MGTCFLVLLSLQMFLLSLLIPFCFYLPGLHCMCPAIFLFRCFTLVKLVLAVAFQRRTRLASLRRFYSFALQPFIFYLINNYRCLILTTIYHNFNLRGFGVLG